MGEAMNKLIRCILLVGVSVGLSTAFASPFLDHLSATSHHGKTALAGKKITKTYIDALDRLWVATSAGIYYFEDRQFHLFNKLVDGQNDYRRRSFSDLLFVDNKLWALSLDRLLIYDLEREKFEAISLCPGSACRGLRIKFDEGAVWVGTSVGLGRFDAASQSILYQVNNHVVHDMQRVEQGLYLVASTRGLFQFDSSEGTRKSIPVETLDQTPVETLDKNPVETLNAAPVETAKEVSVTGIVRLDGRYWLSTNVGLALLDSQGVSPVMRVIQPTSALQTLFLIDKDRIWLSPATGDILEFNLNSRTLRKVKLLDDTNREIVKPLAYHYQRDRFNNIWIASAGHGLIQLNRFQQHITYTSGALNTPKRVFSTLQSDHKVLLGLHNRGLLSIPEAPNQEAEVGSSRVDEAYAQTPHTVLSLMEEQNGSLWLGTDRGLRLITSTEAASLESLSFRNGIAHAITADSKGRIWFALRGEIGLLEAGHESVFQSDGVGLKGRFFTSITEDSDGEIWLGGQAGLFQFDNSKKQFAQKSSRENLWITHINAEQAGYLYLSAMQGFYRYTIATNTLEKFPEEQLSQAIVASYWFNDHLWVLAKQGLYLRNPEGQWHSITQQSGLAAYHFNYGAASFSKGRILAGAEQGVASFDLAALMATHEPASSYLSSADFGEERGHKVFAKSTKVLSLASDHAPVTLTWNFSDLGVNGLIEYRFRTQNGPWSSWSSQAKFTLASLKFGSHRLETQVRVGGNARSEVNYVSVEVETPWYLHPLAVFLYGVLILASLLVAQRAYYQVKNRRLVARQQELESLVAEKTEHLSQLDRLKTEFFCNITHEIRTPLTLNIGNLQYILKKFDVSDAVREALRQATNNAKRLMFLVNQILDVNRHAVAADDLNISPHDLCQFLGNVSEGFKMHAVQQDITLAVALPQQVVPVAFDPEKMERIVFNLMANAFKYTPAGGTIRLLLEVENESAKISVIDSGVGIAPDHLPRLFDRFFSYSSDSQISYASSGIGLSIVKSLVERQQGQIEVESQVDEGSRFTVCFPLVTDKDVHVKVIELPDTHLLIDADILPNSQKPMADLAGNQDNQDKPTLLLVEDNHELRQLLRRIFVEKYNVLEADNGQTGLQVLRRYTPDLVICDVMMPQMNGLEFVTIAKGDPETNFIPVFLLTASQNKGNEQQGFLSGADDYIEKPFDTVILSQKVDNYFKTLENRRAHFAKHPIELPKVDSSESLFKKQIETFIDENICEIGVSDLAAHLKLDGNQLYRRIKKEYSLSPQNLLRDRRLVTAASLLRTGDDYISVIAYQVGFSNLSYFTRSFKEKYGVTPNQYRNDKVS